MDILSNYIVSCNIKLDSEYSKSYDYWIFITEIKLELFIY